jgi:DNA invertase Pin-like site-specific DNA recombinase
MKDRTFGTPVTPAADSPGPAPGPAVGRPTAGGVAVPAGAPAPAAAARARRNGPRSRAEAEAERRQAEAATARELDRLAAEFHARLPRDRAGAVGAIYARYSSRYQHSITDQVRALHEAAAREGVFVPRAHVCFDQAVRGCKERRPGLQELRRLLGAGAVQVLLVLTTNRLYRKTYKALQFVEEEVVERGIRCLFVKSGVDTADGPRWQMLLQLAAMTDEFVAGMYADNIRAAHEGLFDKALVWGTITFGYRGKAVAGAPTRRQRARREYEIDPQAAAWVRRIFAWYADDGLPVAAIVRRLNDDPAAPLGPRAVSGRWTRLAVRLVLSNPRYRGLWAYGKSKTVWQAKKDYARQVPRAQPLRVRQCEGLRLVSDELWFRAQRRLAAEPGAGGRRPKDGGRRPRPRLLNGFFACQEHGRRLHVGGVHGQFMVCPECQALPAPKRPLFTQLNRARALRLTCAKLAELIRPDEALVREVIAACQREVIQGQQPDPERLAAAQGRQEKLTRQIQFLLGNAGDSDADRREAEAALRRLRGERAQVAAEVAELEAARRPAAVPSAREIEGLLARMGETLAAAGQSGSDEDVSAVRQVVALLTGGRIELVQQGARRAQRGWLQGRFRLRLLPHLVARAAGRPAADGADGPEVTIDYREPTAAEAWAERVKALYDAGLLIKAIAAQLGIRPNLARRALASWGERHGQGLPDGRSRRAGLAQRHLQRPRYQEIADRVMALYDRGVLLGDIATALRCDRNTVTKAVAHWHAARGLPVPDGRTRRKSLPGPSSAAARGRGDSPGGPPDGGQAP